MLKNLFFLFFLILIIDTAHSQAPEMFNYQAVVRTPSGAVVENQEIGMKFIILQSSVSGSIVYKELHDVKTNDFGLVNLQIGSGKSEDDFSEIDWSKGPYFIEVAVDLEKINNYEVIGTSQLISVPYALFSGIADSATKAPGININNSPASGNLITYDGENWYAADIATGNTGGGQAFNNMPPYTVINYCIALQGIFPSRSFDPFIGQINAFGFNFAPRGWATCNGQLLPISSYTALFSLLGTMYGGDGRTTFALPDLRGRTPVHQGTGPGLSQKSMGEKGGSETTTLTISNLPSHNHTIYVSE